MVNIIKIKMDENGSHDNMTYDDVWYDPMFLPDGWAVIPDAIEIPATYPFVNIEVEERNYTRHVETKDGLVEETSQMMTVTSMTAGVMPGAELEP